MSLPTQAPDYRRRLNTRVSQRSDPGTTAAVDAKVAEEAPANLNITVRSSAPLGSISYSSVSECLNQNGKAVRIVLAWLLMTNMNIIFDFPIEWFYFLAFTFHVTTKYYRTKFHVFCLLAFGTFMLDFAVLRYLSFKTTAVVATAMIQIILISGTMKEFGLLTPSIEGTMGVIVVLFFIALRFAIWDVSPINSTYIPSFTESVSNGISADHQTMWSSPSLSSTPLQSAAPPPLQQQQQTTNNTASKAPLSLLNILHPLAVHCTSFALMYTSWKLFVTLSTNFDLVCQFFGCVSPQAPSLLVEEITARSVRISWGQSKAARMKALEECGMVLGLAGPFGVGVPPSNAGPCGGGAGGGGGGVPSLSAGDREVNDRAVNCASLVANGGGFRKGSTSRGGASRGKVGNNLTSTSSNDKNAEASEESERENDDRSLFLDDRFKYASPRKYVIEVGGKIIGDTAKNEQSIDIKGLQPGVLYNIRVWAVGAKNMTAVSKTVTVKTLERKGDSDSEPKRVKSVHVQTTGPPQPLNTPIPSESEAKPTFTAANTPKDAINQATSTTNPMHDLDPSETDSTSDQTDQEQRITKEMSRLTAAIESTQRLQSEFEKQLCEITNDHDARMDALTRTLDTVRAERKRTEPHRTALKLELKRLEELKRHSESKRAKVEHALNAAKAEGERVSVEILRGEKESVSLGADIVRAQARAKLEEEAFDRKKKELDEQVSRIKEELMSVDAMRSKAKKTEESIRNEIRVKEAVIAGIQTETATLEQTPTQKLNDVEELEKKLEEDLRIWSEIHEKLVAEYTMSRAVLKEEKRVKEVLLQELVRSRSRQPHHSSVTTHSITEGLDAPVRQGTKIRLLQGDLNSHMFPSAPSLFAEPASSAIPPSMLQSMSSASGGISGVPNGATSLPHHQHLNYHMQQDQQIPLMEPILFFEPNPLQTPPGLAQPYDVMGSQLPMTHGSMNKGFSSSSLIHSSPTEPPGLAGFSYTQLPYGKISPTIQPLAQSLTHSHSLTSEQGDEIERAVANSLLGEINGFS
ncbi:hypothetical protein CcCBS67573_g03360 [Chytriomyces confervae]|uniref:Fibronectin type-III domain-containing protein n=1 Tax=Chytriomyces confervae TaxID=246404 RepID=A0A507FGL0_9FUNG|nr:hypothetical protein HDU80_001912 [Chytriomyces hyalinus]TPX75384.1 hypothetical protein CcCBS67573_g03360 [Chytriomyces confervae]